MSINMPDFLKKESLVPVKKLQEFTFLDRDEFLSENDVDAVAKKEARLNLPATASSGMDSNELILIQQLTQAATAATMTLNMSLGEIAKAIASIDIQGEKAELDNAVEKIKAQLRKEYSQSENELEKLRKEAEARRKMWTSLRKKTD